MTPTPTSFWRVSEVTQSDTKATVVFRRIVWERSAKDEMGFRPARPNSTGAFWWQEDETMVHVFPSPSPFAVGEHVQMKLSCRGLKEYMPGEFEVVE